MNGGVGVFFGFWFVYGFEFVVLGIVYFWFYVFFYDIMFLSDEIFILVVEVVWELGI